ncbi:hypothetical protein QOZ80_5BG0443880 [Eleusine coracana subsp. coracana]|nr:hypothetical protein QOZ80_5BG0443880 [Eleusine coracana subsp. coracana]
MDLKPANILLGDHMEPKITDFGVSRLDDKSQTTSTRRFMSLGYCAPEYRDHGKRSAKSDLYSLGVIILEMVTGSKDDPNITKVLRRWRHRWNKSSVYTPYLWYGQVAKCIELAQWCKRDNPIDRPYIWDVFRELNQIDGWDGQIRYATVSTLDMILSSLDDMLSIEPLEMFLPFSRNNDKSCSIELSNDTDDHFAFRIATTSILPFNIQPEKGFVPPRSKCCATITLQAQEKAVHNRRSEEFSVQSSRVDSNLTSMDVTGDMFNENVGKVVDEVNLMVVFEMPPEPKDLQNDIAVASQFAMSEGSVKYQQGSAAYPHLNTGEGLLGRSAQELLFAPTAPDAPRSEHAKYIGASLNLSTWCL